jgi:GNAT superfamily N-acetyltransferase
VAGSGARLPAADPNRGRRFSASGKAKNPYALCVIVPIADGYEIKNIATRTIMRRQGMASALIAHVVELAKTRGVKAVEIGTGETPGVMGNAQIRLYEKLGFKRDGIVRKDFFRRYPESPSSTTDTCWRATW